MEANVTGTCILNATSIRKIEDGPYGGTSLDVGSKPLGQIITMPFSGGGQVWGGVRLNDCSVAQVAFALLESRLWLPGDRHSHGLSVTTISDIGKMGYYHLDINGPRPRGPFDKIAGSPTATYPCLWNHDAESETRLVCHPDSQLIVRSGLEEKAATVWATASHSHLNRDFRFNSQCLAVAYTTSKSIGGRAWPNVYFDDTRFDYVLTAWSNSTLGLLSFWWHANRQQDGRGVTSIRSAETLPVLDFRTLTTEQLAKAEEIFEEFRDKELMPAYLADADSNRALLDRRVICDLLGFDESIYQGVRRLAQKWCAEPSVHGGKARPKNAHFAI